MRGSVGDRLSDKGTDPARRQQEDGCGPSRPSGPGQSFIPTPLYNLFTLLYVHCLFVLLHLKLSQDPGRKRSNRRVV